MSRDIKDLKDLIDTVDSNNQCFNDMEILKKEIKRLSLIINDQRILITDLKNKSDLGRKSGVDLPGDIKILKDMIISQRQDITQKDKDLDVLKQTVSVLKDSTENPRLEMESVDNEELIRSKKEIENLKAENEMILFQVHNLKSQLNELHKESLKNGYSKEMKSVNKKIEALKSDLNNFQEEITFIGQSLESIEDVPEVLIPIHGSITEFSVNYKKQTKALQEELDYALALNISMSEQLSSSLEEMKSLKQQLKELMTNYSAKDQFKEMELMNTKIQSELNFEDFNHELDLLKQQNSTLQKDLDDALSSNKFVTEQLEFSLLQIKTLKNQIEESKVKTPENNLLEELELANREIQKLTLKKKDFLRQIAYLRQEIEKLVEYPRSSINGNHEKELLKYKRENQELNNIILQLKSTSKPSNKIGYILNTLPKRYQNHLFRKMIDLLSENGKSDFIELLIQDLKSSSNGVKKFIISILSEFKSEKVFDIFVDLVHSNDWMVRYNAIRALNKFDNEQVKKIAEELTHDQDVDVREAAKKLLKNKEAQYSP